MRTTPSETQNSRFESDGMYFKVASVSELEQRPYLQEDEKALADVHALINCARDSFMGPPRRMLRPLPTTQFTNKAQLKHWFRLFIEDREAAGAERVLRTDIADE